VQRLPCSSSGRWGRFLAAFGRHVHLLLPAMLLRFVPGSEQRADPGARDRRRVLAAAMLAAQAFAMLRERNARGLAALLALLVVLDYAPAPVRVFRVDDPSVYETLRQLPGDGALCELPLGVRDGFRRARRRRHAGAVLSDDSRPPISTALSRGFPPAPSRLRRGPRSRTASADLEGRPLASERPLDPSGASTA
jgi:hypothetical protein